MIEAELYKTLYLIFVILLTILFFTNVKRFPIGNEVLTRKQKTTGFLVLMVITIFIGLRPLSDVFADMGQYTGYLATYSGQLFQFDWNVENKVYDNLLMFLACNGVPFTFFYLFISTVYFVGNYIAYRRIFPGNSYLAFIMFLAAFSTFSYSVNGIKAGAASTVFLLAISYRDNWKIWVPFLLLSFGIHHGMQLPVLAFIAVKYYSNPKYYFYFWAFCFLMAAAHITVFQTIFADYTNEKGARYLNGDIEWGGKAGFRIDFILYSFMPILMGWYATKKLQIKSAFYNMILCIYLLCNGVWMLCIYVNYNNRIAYLSWMLYVPVMMYPLLNEKWGTNRERVIKRVAYAHLAFTLFMHFIYYGGNKFI